MQDKKMNGEVDDDIDLTEEETARKQDNKPVKFHFRQQEVSIYEANTEEELKQLGYMNVRATLDIVTTNQLCDELKRKYPKLCQTISDGYESVRDTNRIVEFIAPPGLWYVKEERVMEYGKTLFEIFRKPRGLLLNKDNPHPYASQHMRMSASFAEWADIVDTERNGHHPDMWGMDLMYQITLVLRQHAFMFECHASAYSGLLENALGK